MTHAERRVPIIAPVAPFTGSTWRWRRWIGWRSTIPIGWHIACSTVSIVTPCVCFAGIATAIGRTNTLPLLDGCIRQNRRQS